MKKLTQKFSKKARKFVLRIFSTGILEIFKGNRCGQGGKKIQEI